MQSLMMLRRRDAKATSRDYYRQLQSGDGRTPKGMFDDGPENRTTFKPNKISGQPLQSTDRTSENY